MPRGYVHSGKNADPAARHERAKLARAAQSSPAYPLRRITGQTPEQLAAGARMLTPAEAVKVRAALAVVASALPPEGADGS
jgi:hypothetical protein